MDPVTLASIGVPSVTGLVSDIFGFGSNNANNKAQMKLAKYNWDKQIEFWNMQNDYNTPTAQMKRFADSGLNPNLMYGQGTNGNSSFSPTPAMPKTSPYQPKNTLHGVNSSFQVMNLLSQNENLKVQNENIKADTELKRAQDLNTRQQTSTEQYRTLTQHYENQLKYLDILYKQRANPILIRKLEKDLEETQERIRSLRLSNDFNESANPTRLDILDEEYKESRQKVLNAIKYGQNIDADTALKYEMKATERTKQSLNNSEAALNEVKRIGQEFTNKILEDESIMKGETHTVREAVINAEFLNLYNDVLLQVKDGRIKDEQHLKAQIENYYLTHGIDIHNSSSASYLYRMLPELWKSLRGFNTTSLDYLEHYNLVK